MDNILFERPQDMRKGQPKTEDNIGNSDIMGFALLLLALMVVGAFLVEYLAELSGFYFVLSCIGLCISQFIAVLIYGDAEHYNRHPWIWGLCSFLLFPLVPIAYFFYRQ